MNDEVIINLNFIEEKVVEIISQYVSNIDKKELLEKNITDLGINSFSFVKIIVQMESVFDVDFGGEYLMSSAFESVNDIINYVNKLFINCNKNEV